MAQGFGPNVAMALALLLTAASGLKLTELGSACTGSEAPENQLCTSFSPLGRPYDGGETACESTEMNRKRLVRSSKRLWF